MAKYIKMQVDDLTINKSIAIAGKAIDQMIEDMLEKMFIHDKPLTKKEYDQVMMFMTDNTQEIMILQKRLSDLEKLISQLKGDLAAPKIEDVKQKKKSSEDSEFVKL